MVGRPMYLCCCCSGPSLPLVMMRMKHRRRALPLVVLMGGVWLLIVCQQLLSWRLMSPRLWLHPLLLGMLLLLLLMGPHHYYHWTGFWPGSSIASRKPTTPSTTDHRSHRLVLLRSYNTYSSCCSPTYLNNLSAFFAAPFHALLDQLVTQDGYESIMDRYTEGVVVDYLLNCSSPVYYDRLQTRDIDGALRGGYIANSVTPHSPLLLLSRGGEMTI